MQETLAETCPPVSDLQDVIQGLKESTVLHFVQSYEQTEADATAGRPDAQSTLAHLYPNMITEEQEAELVDAIERLLALNPTINIGKTGDNRSATLAYHFGVWLMTRLDGRAAPTLDSRQARPECNDAIDTVLILIKRYILDPLEKIIAKDYPQMYARAQRYAL